MAVNNSLDLVLSGLCPKSHHHPPPITVWAHSAASSYLHPFDTTVNVLDVACAMKMVKTYMLKVAQK